MTGTTPNGKSRFILLEGYTKEIFRPECNHTFESLHCYAHLDQDISCVLPLLNEVLGGHSYQKEPPALTLKAHGKLITLHARMIAINALKDEHEVDRVLEWLQCQINETWEKRHEIEPSFEVHRPPVALELLRHLPRTNCGQCGMPTCLVFAMTLAEGGVEPSRCPPLSLEKRHMIAERMGR